MKNALASAVLVCVALPLVAQQAILTHNSSLRSGPSSSNRLITTLPTGTAVTVISKHPRSGYVKVETTEGTGWVWTRNVQQKQAETAGIDRFIPDLTLHLGRRTRGSVRPPAPVTNKIKQQTMHDYGFADAANHYELDHLISPQNGGCPDCVENLWPQAYGDKDHAMTQHERAKWNRENPNSSDVLPGALEKDIVENHIHDEICLGIPDAKMSSYRKKYPPTVTITLERGQQILATDWYACYRNMLDHNTPVSKHMRCSSKRT